MRFVVIGAGAIGGVVGGYLARAGQDVVHPPAAATPAELGLADGDVVLLAVKGQDTVGALDTLVEAGACRDLPIAAGIVSEVRPDIMRWKWAKLLVDLGNAIEVVCGPAARFSDLGRAVNREGRAVLDAAGVTYASADEDRERRGDILQWTPDAETGGSTWQSATRGTPLETDLLTGEIVRLGAANGVPTPVNSLLVRLAAEQSDKGEGAGSRSPDDVLAQALAG